MVNRFSDWIGKVSSGWIALAALGTFILFSALVLPAQAARAGTMDGNAGSPDLSLFYSTADLYRMANAYGEQGRSAYIRARFTFDLVWPLVYTLFLSTAISWVSRRAFTPDSRWLIANLAPVLGAIFDILENLSTSLVMLRYPQETSGVDFLAPYFTLVKWILITGSFVFLLAGLVLALRRRFRNLVRR